MTGTAAWNYAAITQWILGIRPTLNGLEVAPVIPQAWPGFTASRTYRGVRYDINVIRQGKGNQIKLVVDGESLPGTVIPLGEGMGTRRVQVTIS